MNVGQIGMGVLGGAQAGPAAQAGYQNLQTNINPTIGKNIDNKILRLKDEILRLENTKKQLDRAGFLEMSISDLREAMNY